MRLKKVGCRDSMGLFSREDHTGAAVRLGESGCRAKDKLGAGLEGRQTEKMPQTQGEGHRWPAGVAAGLLGQS